MSKGGANWELYYWGGFKGRAEFVRLVFEEAGVKYKEVNDGISESIIQGKIGGYPVLFPPVIKHGDLVLAQTQVICQYLAEQFDMLPGKPENRYHAEQLNATILDCITEGYNSYHGAKPGVSHKEQKEEAQRYIDRFAKERLPRYLKNFEQSLKANKGGSGFLFGDKITHSDLILFHMLEAVKFQLPEVYKAADYIPLLKAFHARIAARPNIAAYLKSDRCKKFSGDSFM
ncbi:hypothetical protein ACJMK2_023545 [Sinanodonta woodiana]|uniref:Glutathione transferase n=1 Tax=Sinanodonta woodiana TaxID=1069815 RepID=A0ABD3T4K7_SINWO